MHDNIYDPNCPAKYLPRGNNLLVQSDIDYFIFPDNSPSNFKVRLKNPLFLKTKSCGMRMHQFYNSRSFRPWNDMGQWSTIRRAGAPAAVGTGFPLVHKTETTEDGERTFENYEHTNRLDECTRADISFQEHAANYDIFRKLNTLISLPFHPPLDDPVYITSPWLLYDSASGTWDMTAQATGNSSARPQAIDLRHTLGYWQEWHRGIHPLTDPEMSTRPLQFIPPTGDFQLISSHCLDSLDGRPVTVNCQNSLIKYIPSIKRSRNIMVFNVKGLIDDYNRLADFVTLDDSNEKRPQMSIFSIDCSYPTYDKNLSPHYSEDAVYKQPNGGGAFQDVPERNNPWFVHHSRFWKRTDGSICHARESKSGFVTLMGNMIHASWEQYGFHEKMDDIYLGEPPHHKDFKATPNYSIGVKAILPYHVDLGMCQTDAMRASTGIIENQQMPTDLKKSMLWPLTQKEHLSAVGVKRTIDPSVEDACITPPFPPTPAPAARQVKTDKFVGTQRLDQDYGAASGARLEQSWAYGKMDVMQPVRKSTAVPGLYLNDCCVVDFKYMWSVSSHTYNLNAGNSYTAKPIVDSNGEPELNSDGALMCAILGKPWCVYLLRGRKEWEFATAFFCNSAVHRAMKEHYDKFPDSAESIQLFLNKYYPVPVIDDENQRTLTIDERTKGARHGIDFGPDQVFDGILVTNANELDLSYGTGMHFRNPYTDPTPKNPDDDDHHWTRVPQTDDITIFWPMPGESSFAAPYNVLYLYSDIVQPISIGSVQEAPLISTILINDVSGTRTVVGTMETSGYNRECEIERQGTPLDLVLQQISYPFADHFSTRRKFAAGTIASFWDYFPNTTQTEMVYKETKPIALNTKNINTLSFYITDTYGQFVPFHPESSTHIEFYIENQVS